MHRQRHAGAPRPATPAAAGTASFPAGRTAIRAGCTAIRAGCTAIRALLALLVLLYCACTALAADAPGAVPSGGLIDVDARTRRQWQDLERICPNRNYTSCENKDRSGWTDASRTLFADFKFGGLGAWSTFKIRTTDFMGRKKTTGGDSWYVVLRDRERRLKVPTRIYDEGDGTYTGTVFFLKPGVFTVLAWLWYSDCHGLQEPSMHFREYESGGKSPLAKKDHCYLGSRVRQIGFPEVDVTLPLPACMQPGCSPKPHPAVDPATGGSMSFRMETYYYRQAHQYHSCPCCKPRFPKPTRPVERFLFYGDSTVKNSWEMLQYMARRMCKPTWKPRHLHEMFDPAVCPRTDNLTEVDPELDTVLRRCTGGMPWSTAPIGTNTYQVSRYHPLSMLFDMHNFTYNDTYARTHKPPVPLPLPRNFTFVYIDGWGCRAVESYGVLGDLSGFRPGDVAVINIGAHCSRTERFDAWMKYMDKLAKYLKEEIIDKVGVPIIWRTSFMMKEHVFRSYTHADGYVPQAHFNTEHRRLMFDSYAESVLSPLGIHVWDVYGLTAIGDYRPHDMVHSDGATCWAQNTDMMDLFGCFD